MAVSRGRNGLAGWKAKKMNKALLALLLAAGVTTPALADPPREQRIEIRHDGDRDGRWNRGDWNRGDWRGDRHDRWDNRRGDRDGRNWDRNDHRRWDGDRRERRDWGDRDWRGDNHRNWNRGDWREWRRYDYYRPDPRYGRYYPDYYYRDGRYYQPWRMGYGDRIYRGYNGRYYCRRDDGTTGLILGAIGGGLLGDALAPGDSRTVGALIGGTLGAVLGREIDRDGVRCR